MVVMGVRHGGMARGRKREAHGERSMKGRKSTIRVLSSSAAAGSAVASSEGAAIGGMAAAFDAEMAALKPSLSGTPRCLRRGGRMGGAELHPAPGCAARAVGVASGAAGGGRAGGEAGGEAGGRAVDGGESVGESGGCVEGLRRSSSSFCTATVARVVSDTECGRNSACSSWNAGASKRMPGGPSLNKDAGGQFILSPLLESEPKSLLVGGEECERGRDLRGL
jgi:hypothetical protein